MQDGEYLRLQIRGSGKTVEQAATLVGLTRKTLYNYFKEDILDDDIKELFSDKLNLNFTQNVSEPYTEQRRKLKNEAQEEPLPYYNASANASTSDVEIMPAKKQSGVVVSELFKGSKYVIRIAGNSMTPLYPPGGLLGIKPVEMINPGAVYVVESIDGQLWIKRMFYKDDNQDSGAFQLISDNTMKHDCGARVGKLFYPDFFLPFDQVKNLFVVTGVFKSNIITIINEN